MNGIDNTIGGLSPGERNVISGNEEEGIRIDGELSTGNTIIGNFVGISPSGTAAVGNGTHGILVNGPSNTIGGVSSDMRNIISGNGHHGICLDESPASGTIIRGNFIGTDALGSTELGNGDCGIWLRTPENRIGGSQNGGNIISGNSTAGICLAYIGSRDNYIQSNRIGTNSEGTITMGNNGPGIWIRGSSDNTIGGRGVGNIIAGNAGSGIEVQSGIRNLLSENLFFSNDGLGIDLSSDGVTLNDEFDSDSGANDRQNFPDLTEAVFDSVSTLSVSGTLHSAPQTTYTLQFFISVRADESGYGEGEQYIGETTVSSNGNGNVTFQDQFDVGYISGGYVVTATATDNDNNTSEFSMSVHVQGVAADYSAPEPSHRVLVWSPNPVVTTTRILLRLKKPTFTTIRIYNISGERIRTVCNDVLTSGSHTIPWDAKDESGTRVSAGTYLYRVTGEGLNRSGKLVLIR